MSSRTINAGERLKESSTRISLGVLELWRNNHIYDEFLPRRIYWRHLW
jgi:hypothetical protein